MLVTACSLPPALGSITVGDHQNIQFPIQHHSAQLSPQTQLSSSALVPGSNLPPPAEVPCAVCDHLPSVPTQSHNALGCLSKHCQWQPITTDHQWNNLCLGSHREPVTSLPVALGVLRTQPNCAPSLCTWCTASGWQIHSPSVLCSEILQAPLQLHNLLHIHTLRVPIPDTSHHPSTLLLLLDPSSCHQCSLDTSTLLCLRPQ